MTNNGDAGLDVSSVTLTGANSADFAVTTCGVPVVLGQGNACPLNVGKSHTGEGRFGRL